MKLSIIVPVLNEEGNVIPLYDLIQSHISKELKGQYEVIYVDDNSADQTRAKVKSLISKYDNVKLVERAGKFGLSSAVIDGASHSEAEYIAVMDGDLQHDPVIITKMLHKLESGEADLVVGSRYVDQNAHIDNNWSKIRKLGSKFAILLAKIVMHSKKNIVTDPMSGYFMLSREKFNNVKNKLKLDGFKILFDMLCNFGDSVKVKEIAYHFSTRLSGESKMSSSTVFFYLSSLISHGVAKFLPQRFITFGIIGGLGVILHMSILKLLLSFKYVLFVGQFIAGFITMIVNFLLNNHITFFDKKISTNNLGQLSIGILKFILVCSFGLLISASLAHFLNSELLLTWWISSIIGIIAGSVWNYFISDNVIWSNK